jgi:hypothetical protein
VKSETACAFVQSVCPGCINGLARWRPAVTEVFAEDEQRHEQARFPTENDQFLDRHAHFLDTIFGHIFPVSEAN